MLVITVETALLNLTQKREPVSALISQAAAVMALSPESISVFVKQHPLDCVGAGGRMLTDRASH